MEAKSKSQLSAKAKKLMEICNLDQVYATPNGEFYSHLATPQAVHGAEIEVYTFTKVKK